MTYFRDPAELHDHLVAFFQAFMRSEDGARVAERVAGVAPGATVRLKTTDPATEMIVDFAGRKVGAPEDATAPTVVDVVMDADLCHHFWLGHLNPVQISRAIETEQIKGSGPPHALAALVPLVGLLEPHYRKALESRGQTELLATPAPEEDALWTKEGPMSLLLGKQRVWQQYEGEWETTPSRLSGSRA